MPDRAPDNPRAVHIVAPVAAGGESGVLGPGPADHVVERLRSLCEVAVRSLPASGAGLSVLTRDRQYSLLTAADPASERLEELQFVLGEGPCVDAAASRRPVLVPDLADERSTRWPAYASAMGEAGVSAVFAFPLQVGAAQLGVLDFFRTLPGRLSSDELARAFTLADDAVAILLDEPDRSPDTLGQDGMPMGPSEQFQAQGMVMVQIGGTLAEAMSRIRAYAYAENRRLIDVARDVVARELSFGSDQNGTR